MKTGWKIFIIVLIFIAFLALSWFATCGVVKLITLCFSLNFSWKIATGIWLVLLLLTGGVKISIKK